MFRKHCSWAVQQSDRSGNRLVLITDYQKVFINNKTIFFLIKPRKIKKQQRYVLNKETTKSHSLSAINNENQNDEKRQQVRANITFFVKGMCVS